MAAELEIDDRSLRRWLQNNEVPDGVWRDLYVVLSGRIETINSLLPEARGRF